VIKIIKIIIIAAQKTVETFYCVYLWNPECSRMLQYNIRIVLNADGANVESGFF
jgi:hypothetical protein